MQENYYNLKINNPNMTMTMNLIFLDFDGVLNCTDMNESFSLTSRGFYINQENLNNLKTLTQSINAQIVISSTWRKDKNFIQDCTTEDEIIEKFKEFFTGYEWDNSPIIGITPNISGFRGQEVAVFLDNYKYPINNYIILDDDSDFLLSDIKNLSPVKLDRLAIYNEQQLNEKSKYWSYQNLYSINPQTGITVEDVNNLIKKFYIQENSKKPLKTKF